MEYLGPMITKRIIEGTPTMAKHSLKPFIEALDRTSNVFVDSLVPELSTIDSNTPSPIIVGYNPLSFTIMVNKLWLIQSMIYQLWLTKSL